MSEYGLGCALDQFCTGESLEYCGWLVEGDYTSGNDSTSDSTDCEECQPTRVLGSQHFSDLRLNCNWRPGKNVQPGPPPVSFRPPRPPDFLPVPTQPIFAAVNLAAPEPTR